MDPITLRRITGPPVRQVYAAWVQHGVESRQHIVELFENGSGDATGILLKLNGMKLDSPVIVIDKKGRIIPNEPFIV